MIINKEERVDFFKSNAKKELLIKNFLLSLIKSNEKVFKKYDDYKIKKLGYSIIKKNNTIITDIDKLNKNDNIQIDMYNGYVNAKIKELNKYENKKEPQNFEDALKELEELSEMIQDDSTSLDQMLEIFERGSYLSKYCKNKLANVDEKISILIKKNENIEKKNLNNECFMYRK